MSKKNLTIKDLIDAFEYAKVNERDVGIKLKMPGQEKPEIILNYHSSIDKKLEYYKNTYDDNLIHKKCGEIKIIELIVTNIPF